MPNDSYFMNSAKVVLLGDAGVGKTCLLRRVSTDQFFQDQSPTIMAGFIRRSIEIEGQEYEIALWDTAGQEQYRSVIPNTIRNAHFALLVFDVSNQESFQSLPTWIELLRSTSTCRFLIAGNKVDITDGRVVTSEQASDWAAAQYSEYAEVSARSGHGVDALFMQICSSAVEGLNATPTMTGTVNIDATTSPQQRPGTQAPSGCC
jgi:small GTP-binding protein